MNERIKELKIQACKWASENAVVTEYENAADQKFAELIVKECAGIVLNGRAKEDEPWDHSFWNQACENRAYAIKHHFRDEE
jgi:hypothetical protein